jgi:sugar phosphate isomerase/epimerase
MLRPLVSVIASALHGEPGEAPRRARLGGFAGLVFDAYSPGLSLPGLSGSGRREFRHLLASESQRLVAIRFDIGNHGFGPGADIDRILAEADRVFDAAAALAAGCVCIDLGPLPVPPLTDPPRPPVTPEQAGLIILPTFSAAPAPAPAPRPVPPPDPAFLAQVNAAAAELCARADRYRVTLALSASLSSFASLGQVLRDARCPWFGVDLDPVAILRDDWDLDDVFSMVGPHLRHVTARDALSGAERRTRPTIIGHGNVPWEKLLAALDGAGYTGSITIDPTDLPDRPTAAVAGRKHLEQLG